MPTRTTKRKRMEDPTCEHPRRSPPSRPSTKPLHPFEKGNKEHMLQRIKDPRHAMDIGDKREGMVSHIRRSKRMVAPRNASWLAGVVKPSRSDATRGKTSRCSNAHLEMLTYTSLALKPRFLSGRKGDSTKSFGRRKIDSKARGSNGYSESWKGGSGETELDYLSPEMRWRQRIRSREEETLDDVSEEAWEGNGFPSSQSTSPSTKGNPLELPQAVRVVQSTPRTTRRRRGGALRKITKSTGLAVGAIVCAVAWRTAVVNGGVEHSVSVAITEAVDKLNDMRILGHMKVEEAPEWDLVSVGKTPWGTTQEMRTEAAEAFLDMQQAARREGVNLVPISGFRSVKDQEVVFFDIKGERRQTAEERALVSAPPGYSEHHTGYALDIGTKPFTGLTEDFEYTAAFEWLNQNAMRWHFELSFPRDNKDGIMYEPWHWRWVGNIHALETFAAKRR